jgi:hypothetical protein
MLLKIPVKAQVGVASSPICHLIPMETSLLYSHKRLLFFASLQTIRTIIRQILPYRVGAKRVGYIQSSESQKMSIVSLRRQPIGAMLCLVSGRIKNTDYTMQIARCCASKSPSI